VKNLIISVVKVILLFFAGCLVAAIIISFAGCQENDLTSPIDSIDKKQSGTSDTYFRGIIKLDGLLLDPNPIGNSFYRIFGQIEFEQQNILFDPTMISPQRFANIHLVANAEFQYVCTVCEPSPEDELSGFLSNVSDDKVTLKSNSVSLLEKSFRIQDRDDGMMLKIKFAVTYNGIELNAMWLALPNTNVEATEINHY
jgi:hypothetical protein